MNINVRKPGPGQVLVVIANDQAYSAYVIDREILDFAVHPEEILKVTLEEMDKQLEDYRADFEYVYTLEQGDKLEFGCTACKTFMSPVNAKVSVKKGTPEMETLFEHARTEHDGAYFTVRHMDGEPYECLEGHQPEDDEIRKIHEEARSSRILSREEVNAVLEAADLPLLDEHHVRGSDLRDGPANAAPAEGGSGAS